MKAPKPILLGNGRSLTVLELAERWQRRPAWVTGAARRGEIPGAWKLGHLWRFSLAEIVAYEQSVQVESIFTLSRGSATRQQRKD